MQTKKQNQASNIPFPEEPAYLARVQAAIQEALEAAEQSVARHRQDYREFMEYMARNRQIDPKEIFQSEQLLQQEGLAGVFAQQNRDDLQRLLASPYFGRIDIVANSRTSGAAKAIQAGEGQASKNEAGEGGIWYVGRATFRHEGELLVLDWRAPVASLFYDFAVGPAWYDTPEGRIDCRLTRKRQFKISNGCMEYALESSLAVRDEVLQKELSATSSDRMRSIISTIQAEQNQIIRDETARVMIIQGVAGSGKTSIALHRIAYLLYRFKDTLSADNVVILSPNKVFSDHISNVLPELGEKPVYQMGFDTLARLQLEGVAGFHPAPDPLETQDPSWQARTRRKASAAFLAELDAYITHLNETVFVPAAYAFEAFNVEADWVAGRYAAYGRYPVKRRLREIADDIHDRFATRNLQGGPLPKRRQILKALHGMLRLRTSRAVYKDFYRWLGRPRDLVLRGGSLEWADAYPFLYLHAAFEGLRENHRIRHLVVDEMQDYTPTQFAVLKKLFDCKMTILGDFSQSVDPAASHTLEDLCALFPGAKLMRLQKSYRSTLEIIRFASRIRPDAQLTAVERHGPAPQVLACENNVVHLEKLQALAGAALGRGGNLGILAKHQAEAARLFEALSPHLPFSLIEANSESFSTGASVLSVGMSKGLEFDEVIIADADNAHYTNHHDRNLLYVACTRAMHRLTLLYTGEKSRLLP